MSEAPHPKRRNKQRMNSDPIAVSLREVCEGRVDRLGVGAVDAPSGAHAGAHSALARAHAAGEAGARRALPAACAPQPPALALRPDAPTGNYLFRSLHPRALPRLSPTSPRLEALLQRQRWRRSSVYFMALLFFLLTRFLNVARTIFFFCPNFIIYFLIAIY